MTKTEELYARFLLNPVVCTDSRAVTKGSLFFALKGESFDGNRYAAGALDNGAVLAVVDDAKVAADDRYFLVDDVLTALQELAQLHRSQFKGKVIGITGTNGKTTTKELINAVLSSHFRTHATRGNLNNHIGVPLTILSCDLKKTQFMIVEMGANHPGEIDFLCKMAKPEFGIITNVGKAHLEGFGSFEGVIKTKTELYERLKRNNGLAFVSSGQPLLLQHLEKIYYVTYGNRPDDNTRGEVVSSDPFLTVRWEEKNPARLIQTHLVGAYNFDNVMAALCIGDFFDVPAEKAVAAIENYLPANNRSQVMQQGNNQLILDAYNANPSSMKVAIDNFSKMKSDHKVLILGDMFELGQESNREHQAIVAQLTTLKFEEVLLIGPEFYAAAAGSSFMRFPAIADAQEYLGKHPYDNAQILVKGSRGMKLETLLPVLS